MARNNRALRKKQNGNYGVDLGGSAKIESPSPITPVSDDGASNVMGVSSYFGSTYIDLGANTTSDQEMINRYRNLSMYTEIDIAIDNIINEALVYDDDSIYPVSLNLDSLMVSKTIKMNILQEFERVLQLLNFSEKSYAIFKKWYVDGRLYYNIVVDEKNPQDGILEMRPIDAPKMRKVRQVNKEKNQDGVEMVTSIEEYFLYSDNSFFAGNQVTAQIPNNNTGKAIKFNPDSIVYITSGIVDESSKQILSHLHKCIRPANQLRMLEDAVVIYKLARAPERRIFYIDVGNLPKMKAEAHVQDVMNKYRNKIVYDGTTGEVKDNKKFMSMLEDFWMPTRGGGSGTKIDTLPGANPSFTDMIDVDYFKTKLYYALNVPLSRLISQTGFNLGRSSEISRDEINFMKFVYRLQKRFAYLFLETLKRQLILKGIISHDDWAMLKDDIIVVYAKDNYFEELKVSEILNERIAAASAIEPYIGKYFSNEYVRKNIFKQTQEDMDEQDALIMQEFQNPIYYPPQPDADGAGDDGAGDDGAGDGAGGGGISDASGVNSVMSLADTEHSFSRVMAAVQKGKAITVTKGGKTIAKIVGHNIKESMGIVEEFPMSRLNNNLEIFLSTMKSDEVVAITANGSIIADIIKI